MQIYCPGCESWIRVSPLQLFKRELCCPQCGPLKDLVKIKTGQGQTRLLLPPDQLDSFSLFLGILVVLIIVIFTALLPADSWTQFLLELLGLSGLATLLIFLLTPLWADNYLVSKEIWLQKQKMIILWRRYRQTQTMSWDCTPANEPCVAIVHESSPYVLVSSGSQELKLAVGLPKEQLKQIRNTIASFFEQISTSGCCPQAVTVLWQMLQKNGQLCLQNEQSDAESTVSQQCADASQQRADASQQSADASQQCADASQQSADDLIINRVHLHLQGQQLVVHTPGMLTSYGWKILAVFCGLFGWFFHAYGPALGIFVIPLLLVGGDITAVFTPSSITVKSQFFKVLHWEREFWASQLITIASNCWGCQLVTAHNNYRLSYLTNYRCRTYLAGLLQQYLQQYARWRPRARFSLTELHGQPSQITIWPSGLRVFDEIGLNPIAAVLLALLMLLPVLALITATLIILGAYLLGAAIADDQITWIVNLSVLGNLALISYVGFRLIRAPVTIRLHQDQDEIDLVVRREWGAKLALIKQWHRTDGPVEVEIAKAASTEGKWLTIEQNGKTMHLGAHLTWSELVALKQCLVRLLALDNPVVTANGMRLSDAYSTPYDLSAAGSYQAFETTGNLLSAAGSALPTFASKSQRALDNEIQSNAVEFGADAAGLAPDAAGLAPDMAEFDPAVVELGVSQESAAPTTWSTLTPKDKLVILTVSLLAIVVLCSLGRNAVEYVQYKWNSRGSYRDYPPQYIRNQHHSTTGLCFSPDSQRLIAIDNRGARFWRLPNLQVDGFLPGAIDQLQITAQGQLWVIYEYEHDQELKLWDPAKQCFRPSLHLPRRINHYALSRSHLLALTSYRSEVMMWRLLPFVSHRQPLRVPGRACYACFSPDAKLLAVAYSANNQFGKSLPVRIALFHPSGSRPIVTLSGMQKDFLACMVFSPHVRALVAADGCMVRVWQLATHRLVSKIERHRYNYRVQSLCFSPQGEWLLVGLSQQGRRAQGGEIEFWDFKRDQCLGIIPTPYNITAMEISPDGCYLAAALSGNQNTGEVRVWHFKQLCQKLVRH